MHTYGIVVCPNDSRKLKIHKKKSGAYYYCSCVCGYYETGYTVEELKRKCQDAKKR